MCPFSFLFPLFFFYLGIFSSHSFLRFPLQWEHSEHHKLFFWYFAFIFFSFLIYLYLGILVQIFVLLYYLLCNLLVRHWLEILKNLKCLFGKCSESSFTIAIYMNFISRVLNSQVIFFSNSCFYLSDTDNILLGSLNLKLFLRLLTLLLFIIIKW